MSLVEEEVFQPEYPDRQPSFGRRHYPIAIHLTWFAAGILVPALGIVAFMVVDTARLLRDGSLNEAHLIAQHLNATIDVELEKSIAVGQTLATALVANAGDIPGFDAQARDVAKRLGVNIVTRDPSGQQITNTFVPPGTPLPRSNEDILATDRLAAATRTIEVSGVRTATIRNVPAVNAVIPVFEGSKAKYFISASMPPARFVEILREGLPRGWISGLVGRDGRLIARSVDQEHFVGTINTAFMEAAMGSDGIWRGATREGIAVAGVYVRSSLSGWIVSVAVPETVLQAPTRSAIRWLGVLIVASLALSTLLGWRLSRRIASPIRHLAAQARELGEGRKPTGEPSVVSEVNDAMEALQAAMIELDRRAVATDQANEAVRANEERLQLVQETAGIGTVDWDIEADRAVGSPRYYEMFSLPAGSSLSVAMLNDLVHPDDQDRIRRSRELLFARGGPFEEEFRLAARDGDDRWISARGRVDLKQGRPSRLLGAYGDITARKGAEEHLRFLLRELSHRSKNLLAVIQAMAGQTAKTAESVDVFRHRFSERLMGMAASHDLLVNQDWLGASVEQLVRGQLAPFIDARDARLRLRGPGLDLKSEAAEALGLALHELATNSLKYGSLSDPAGTVEISWHVYGPDAAGAQSEDEGKDRRFRMDWIEHTAVPVTPPSHKGFGRMVIEHTVEATLGGKVTLDFPPGGLRWRIDAPATCLAPSARGMAA